MAKANVIANPVSTCLVFALLTARHFSQKHNVPLGFMTRSILLVPIKDRTDVETSFDVRPQTN